MSKSMLKGMFFIKLSANWKRINYDLHNVLGFYSVIPLLIISYSALIWNFEDADKWVKNTLNGNIPTEKKVKSMIPSEELSNREHILNLIGNTMENRLQDKKSAFINFPRSEEGTYYAELAYDGRQYRNEQFNFDQYSGTIVKSQSYKNKNIGYGTALRERNYALHTGSILGLTTRIIYFLAAVIATSLPITGFIIYLNRKKETKT
ncbi:PepSY-associated TM helix domain-containing protein [Chryseobacterium sp. 1B4]